MPNLKTYLRGAGRVLGLGGSGEYWRYAAIIGKRGDAGGLARDWSTVGRDLRIATDRVMAGHRTISPGPKRAQAQG